MRTKGNAMLRETPKEEMSENYPDWRISKQNSRNHIDASDYTSGIMSRNQQQSVSLKPRGRILLKGNGKDKKEQVNINFHIINQG